MNAEQPGTANEIYAERVATLIQSNVCMRRTSAQFHHAHRPTGKIALLKYAHLSMQIQECAR